MAGDASIETRIYFRNRPETPLGRIQIAGSLHDTWRRLDWPMRLLGTYGMVYVIDGGGRYHDALGADAEIQAGDLILLFPDVAHGYGPKPGGQWSELYAHFDGPAFEAWRQAGLLDPARPIHRQTAPEQWRTELEAALTAGDADNQTGQMLQLSRFLFLLTQMLLSGALVDKDNAQPRWLQTALDLLDTDFSLDLDMKRVAQQTGLPYHTFRKRFEQVMGLAPAKYRFLRRIEAACSLLAHTKMSIQEIAESLNFNDVYHFSNRFHAQMSLRPSVYRREARLGTLPR